MRKLWKASRLVGRCLTLVKLLVELPTVSTSTQTERDRVSSHTLLQSNKSELHRSHCSYRAPLYTLKQSSGVILIRTNIILLGVGITHDCRCSSCDLRVKADKLQWWQMSPIRGENFANPHCIWLDSFSRLFSGSSPWLFEKQSAFC